ncbi:MAG: hypothetical protein Q7S02_02755, partial [bacterium]|nr:hypothetical protein [bacterium]
MTSVWSRIIGELQHAIEAVVPGSGTIVFETPPNPSLGDIAVPCFTLARTLKQAPSEIAARIAEALGAHPLVRAATVAGPYVNLTLEVSELARRVLGAVAEAGEQYGNTPHPPTPPLPEGGGETKNFSP